MIGKIKEYAKAGVCVATCKLLLYTCRCGMLKIRKKWMVMQKHFVH